MTYLCVPITGSTCEQMAREIDAARAAGAEMIELRLDYLDQPEVESVRDLVARARGSGCRILVTCRLAEEGGKWTEAENVRARVMDAAIRAGADLVDIEHEAWRRVALLRNAVLHACEPRVEDKLPCRVLLSRHDFNRTPTHLDMLMAGLAQEQCDVAKLACKANTAADSLRMLDALRAALRARPTVALSMGETGILTRVLARKFGAFLTFAALETGKESAPGQVTIREMCELYRWGAVGPSTGVYGVIGCPVAHSMSPAIHNAAFEAVGHDGVYLPIRVEPDFDSFASFVDGCLERPWLDARGFSVTIPHKENLLHYVEHHGGYIEPLAKRIGVANTLVIGTTQQQNAGATPVSPLAAYNTDYTGALDALCGGMHCAREALSGRTVAVLGAGGVSRAIVAGLRDCGASVTITNRTAAKASALAAEFGCATLPWDGREDIAADVIINCTSIGMWPDVEANPLPARALRARPAVFDTIYNPIETRLLREAREQGCRTIDGVAMFVNQAVAQFERWTHLTAPLDLMRRVVLQRLAH